MKGAQKLDKKAQKTIIAGSLGSVFIDAGKWWCSCNSGVNIGSVPDCTASNCNWACNNQGGWTGACGSAG